MSATPERPPVVELADVCFARNRIEILRAVSWRIVNGEHWALLGANGSGKTSLLKIITGYEWPNSGSVHVLSRTYGECDLRELRKMIGWVSAALDPQLPDHDTAVAVVVSGLEASMGLYREFTASEWERARQCLAAVGAGACAERAYGLLSQGEQQRVRIARALVNQPALLILDEPCAGLDPVARELFLGDLACLARGLNGPTIVLVTHHIEEIGDWVGRVLVLREGRVLAQGTANEMLTAATLGRAFGAACRVTCEGGRYRLQVDDGAAKAKR